MSFPPGPARDDRAAWHALLDDDGALTGGVAAILACHGLQGEVPKRYDSGSLPVYAVGSRHVLKLFPPYEPEFADNEARALAAVHGRLPIPTPALIAQDILDGWPYLLMTQLHGPRLVDAWPQADAAARDALAEALGHAVAALHAIDGATLVASPPWPDFVAAQAASAAQRQHARGLDAHWVDQIEPWLAQALPPPPPRLALLHTELMREHLLVAPEPGGRLHLSGLFDFEPAMRGAPEYDFASFGLFVACGDARFLRRALRAYGYREGELTGDALPRRLMAHTLLHRYSHLGWYLERLPAPHARTLDDLARRWFAL